jgi:hypothetical protein
MTVKQILKTLNTYFNIPSPWDTFIVFILNVIITIPIFLLVHQNIKDLNWIYHLDRLFIFIFIFLLLQIFFHYIRKVLIFGIFIYILFLIFGTFFGSYDFERVYKDYKYMLYSIANEAYPQSLIVSKLYVFPNKKIIIDAIEYTNPKVRNFALFTTTKHFNSIKITNENRNMIHAFAVFKEIQSRWNYVNDPVGGDYYARASESLLHFSGDCDDHSILMAACLRSVGNIPRLIHTKGHIYPELLIGSNKELEMANYLIREELFKNEVSQKIIHYHIDENQNIWLNMDYTAKYPGGPFLSEEVLGALTLD